MRRGIGERGFLGPVDEVAAAGVGEVRYAISVEGAEFLGTVGVIVPPRRRQGRSGFAPLDLGGAGELEGAAGREVEEQEGGFWLDGEVAEAVEQVISGVIGPPQLVAVDTDKPWRAAPVGGVAAPFRVGGAEKE